MFNWSCLTFKLNTPIIITSLVMMLCFLAHCIDVNTDNKRRSKIQRAAYLKTKTETFKYFSYFLYNICPLKIQMGGNKNHLLNCEERELPLEETYLDDSSTHKKMGSWRFFQED